MEIATCRSRLFAIASPSRTTVSERTSSLVALEDRLGAVGGGLILEPGVSEGSSVRVVVADDSMLTREGIVRLLRQADIDVVDGAEDADELVRHVRTSRGFSCPNLPTSTAGSSPCSPSCAHRRSHRHPPESTTAAARLRPRRSPRHTIRRGSRLRTVELRLDDVAGETPMLTPPTPGSAGCPTVGGPGRSPCDRRRRPSRRCS